MQDKIYCFQWDITNNNVFRQEYDCYINEKSSFIHFELEDGRDISLNKSDVENENSIDAVKLDGNTILFIYTFTDDVNRALEMFNKKITEYVNKAKNELNFYENLLGTLVDKQEYIKNKYPSGKKLQEIKWYERY